MKAKVTNWGRVEDIGTPVERVGGFGVRYPNNKPISTPSDRELFLRDPKAYIEKRQRENAK